MADFRNIVQGDPGEPRVEKKTNGPRQPFLYERISLRLLAQIRSGLAEARRLGLVVNAGHGLHYHNVQPIAALPGINELNIGHAIIARALFSGLHQAVVDMRELIERAAGPR